MIPTPRSNESLKLTKARLGPTKDIAPAVRLRRLTRALGTHEHPHTDMGLEIVELVMDVERAFGVQIPKSTAEQLRTVGSLFDYVRRHIAPGAELPDDGPYAGALWEALR